MKRYYLASWVGQKVPGQILFGNSFFMLTGKGASLEKISEQIRAENNSDFITILSLQQLGKEEYEMLKGQWSRTHFQKKKRLFAELLLLSASLVMKSNGCLVNVLTYRVGNKCLTRCNAKCRFLARAKANHICLHTQSLIDCERKRKNKTCNFTHLNLALAILKCNTT